MFFLFSKKKNNSEAWNSFLQQEKNPLFKALTEEINSRRDMITPCFTTSPTCRLYKKGEILLMSFADIKDEKFYWAFFKKLVAKDYPFLQEQFVAFQKRRGCFSDARLYASEIESLLEACRSFSDVSDVEIDWQKTTKNQFWMKLKDDFLVPETLSLAQQKTLANFIGYLLFEKHVFMSCFQNIGFTREGKFWIFSFDSLYHMTPELLQFLKKFSEQKATPHDFMEYKLSYLIDLLKKYCPEVELISLWNEYMNYPILKEKETTIQDEKLLNLMENCGINTYNVLPKTSENIISSLSTYQHRVATSDKKSSVLYWGPIFILFCLIWYFF